MSPPSLQLRAYKSPPGRPTSPPSFLPPVYTTQPSLVPEGPLGSDSTYHMPSTVILGSGIVGLSTAYYLAALTNDNNAASSSPSSSASSSTASPPPAPHTIHLVEPAPRLFASASGNAAGFLAKDWFAPALAPLGALSFDLHRELADKHDGRRRWGWAESVSYSLDWESDVEDGEDEDEEAEGSEGEDEDEGGYGEAGSEEHLNAGGDGGNERERVEWIMSGASRSQAASMDAARTTAGVMDEVRQRAREERRREKERRRAHSGARKRVRRDGPEWLRASPDALQAISDAKSTGQVNPRQFCEFLLEECKKLGVQVHHPARATALLRDADGNTRVHVEYTQKAGESGAAREEELPCTSLVIAAGCWTPRVYSTLFPNAGRVPRIMSLAGWSVVFERENDDGEEASPYDTDKTPTQERTLALGAANRAEDSAHCHAIFTSDPSGFSPELFSRASGELWLGGLNSSTIPLPALPPDCETLLPQGPADLTRGPLAAAQPRGAAPAREPLPAPSSLLDTQTPEAAPERDAISDEVARAEAVTDAADTGSCTTTSDSPIPDALALEALARLEAVGRRLIGRVRVVRRALCFRPVSATGRPIVSHVHEADLGDGVKPAGGVFIATGHGPWGIALAPGTGRVVAEMVLGRTPSADVAQLGRW
ncbi:hypothetical protein CERSUDRAFT_91225 [Gelatoporia subvermispora B]|uniref:FAD dependent oxidoreductase domain-containing protein n=1 Tax=Ceriporiopsis subvermispora (strain B) TaxID=914234 RepID=M2PUS0_CERS8|nr:hypothetical protein CERSUDRAFT_91225 [Gelatoporia subvermispora B]